MVCVSCGRRTDELLKGAKLRPVFRQEIELMSRLVGRDLMRNPRDLVLWRNGHDYYALGRKVFRLAGGNCDQPPVLSVHDAEIMAVLARPASRLPAALRRPASEQMNLLREANSVRLAILEEEAVSFLRDVRRDYPDLPLVVSWSGGKDSAVASAVAQRAFPEERITHVFADTTMELPTTYEYLKRFREENPATPFVVGLPVRGFFDLCREIGPPSHIQRWCCTTHKAAPLSDVLSAVGGGSDVLAVCGLRRSESQRRKAYPRVITQGKIGKQVLLSPLADWTDFDIWVWLLTAGGALNRAYLYGLDRVGCAFCPDASDWGDMIGLEAFSDHYRPWLSLLTEIAAAAGLERPEEYASSGAWKSRRGGNIGTVGLARASTYDIVTTPCQNDECSTSYELIEQFDFAVLGELLKPFGAVSRSVHADEMAYFEVVGPHGAFAVKAIPLWKRIRVTFEGPGARRRLEGTLRLQLRKLQACVGCGACAAVCPSGAITRVGPAYHIAEAKCSHCLQCARGLKAGCRAAQSLNRMREKSRA